MTDPSPDPDALDAAREYLDDLLPGTLSEDRDIQNAIDDLVTAAIRSATKDTGDAGLRERVETVIATWEREPVWTRADVAAGLRAALSSTAGAESGLDREGT